MRRLPLLLQASLFGRVIGAAGFQLINVNNVSLRLGGWQTDTQLLSRKALAATLTRHFRDEVIKEAHKVGRDRWTCVAASTVAVLPLLLEHQKYCCRATMSNNAL